jgi:hypothetical protein
LRQTRALFAVVVVLLSLCVLTLAQTAGKVEPLGPLTEAAVPESIRAVLDAKGSLVRLDDNSVAAEIWFRKDLPAQPKKETPDVIYDRLAESVLVGVLHFAQNSTDYRGQAVPAGFYTLRYELIPNDGNHLGVAPSRDFLLLVPATADPGPDKVLKFQELVALSRQASRSKHPAPLSLLPAEGTGTTPAVSKDDQDHYIFSAGIKLAGGEAIPVALVVKGTAPQ